ncbi:hypothetical protein BH11ACT6_BH11ACT6_05070 [soil metagenome]
MNTMTAEDAIKAASSVARDVADGKLAPADLEAQAVTELRQLFGVVIGPDDPLWETQADVARQAIALGALTADELGEWTAVMRRREAPAVPDADQTAPEPISTLSGPHSPENEAVEPIAAVVPETVVVAPVIEPKPVVTPLRPVESSGGYDPLAHWQPGATRRL